MASELVTILHGRIIDDPLGLRVSRDAPRVPETARRSGSPACILLSTGKVLRLDSRLLGGKAGDEVAIVVDGDNQVVGAINQIRGARWALCQPLDEGTTSVRKWAAIAAAGAIVLYAAAAEALAAADLVRPAAALWFTQPALPMAWVVLVTASGSLVALCRNRQRRRDREALAIEIKRAFVTALGRYYGAAKPLARIDFGEPQPARQLAISVGSEEQEPGPAEYPEPTSWPEIEGNDSAGSEDQEAMELPRLRGGASQPATTAAPPPSSAPSPTPPSSPSGSDNEALA